MLEALALVKDWEVSGACHVLAKSLVQFEQTRGTLLGSFLDKREPNCSEASMSQDWADSEFFPYLNAGWMASEVMESECWYCAVHLGITTL